MINLTVIATYYIYIIIKQLISWLLFEQQKNTTHFITDSTSHLNFLEIAYNKEFSFQCHFEVWKRFAEFYIRINVVPESNSSVMECSLSCS